MRNNKEEYKIYERSYYLKNRKRLGNLRKKRYLKNKDKELKKNKKWRDDNREKVIRLAKEWRKQNKDYIKEYHKKYDKEYQRKNREKINQIKYLYYLKKRKENKDFDIKEKIRIRVISAFKYYLKYGKYLKAKEFNINYKLIIEQLKPFPKNISKYHIDHIIPLKFFDFNDPNQIERAFAPENHQWLTAKENIKKGAFGFNPNHKGFIQKQKRK